MKTLGVFSCMFICMHNVYILTLASTLRSNSMWCNKDSSVMCDITFTRSVVLPAAFVDLQCVDSHLPVIISRMQSRDKSTLYRKKVPLVIQIKLELEVANNI